MIIGIPVYDGVDLLDVMGPYEMLKWIPKDKGIDTVLISQDGGPVTSMNDVKFEVHESFASMPELDVLWTPGGAPSALRKIMTDPDAIFLDYLRRVSENAEWVCSVCEGALLLAQAGLLNGYNVTTHWMFVSCLKEFPEVTVVDGHPRFVVCGNRLTGGGISSGLDESLKLIELLTDQETAEGVQVFAQYFPDPPVMGTIPPSPDCPFSW